MHPNVRKLYVLNLLAGITFWSSIEKLFMLRIGVNPFGIAVNTIVFVVTLVAFDIPAGVLADHWKRKYTLQLGFLALLLSSVIGGFSQNLAEYVPMTIALGGFIVLTQGTFQALMYDSLEDTGHQASYDKHQGFSYALFLAGLSISSVAGGYMADAFGFRANYFMTAGVMAGALLLTITLTEPKSHQIVSDQNLRRHIHSSFEHIVSSKLLLQLSLLVIAVSVLQSAQVEYAGLLFVALGMGPILMGYAGAVQCLLSAFGQASASKVGRRALRLAPLLFVTCTVFSLFHNRWSLPFFYLACLLAAVLHNQAEAAVQDVTPSQIRATTLSVLTFSSNLVLVPLGLLFGWLALSSVFNAYLMMSAAGLLYLMSWLIVGRNELRHVYEAHGSAAGHR